MTTETFVCVWFLYCLRILGPPRSLLNPIMPNNLALGERQCDRLIDEVASDPDLLANFIDAPNGNQTLKDRIFSF